MLNEARDEREKQWIVAWIGTNDIQSDGISSASLISVWQDIGSRARAAGFKVAFCTIINRGDFSSANSASQGAANSWLTASAVSGGYADLVVDLAADTRLQNTTDGTYFNADAIHLTDTGYQVVADLMRAQLAEPLGVSGTAAAILPVLRGAATGQLRIAGMAGATLGVLQAAGTGRLGISGYLNTNLATLRLSATGAGGAYGIGSGAATSVQLDDTRRFVRVGRVTAAVGETPPPFAATLTLADRATPQDLTAATVTIDVVDSSSGATVFAGRPVTVVDAIGGKVRYEWAPADTARAGRMHARFRVTYSDGRRDSFPNGHDGIPITIRA